MQMTPLKLRGSQWARFFMKSNLNFYIPLQFYNCQKNIRVVYENQKCYFIICWIRCETFINEVAYSYSEFFIINYQLFYYINEEIAKMILKFDNLIGSISSSFVRKFSRKASKCSLKYEIPSGRSKGKGTFCLFHQNVTLRITTFCYVVSRLVVCCTIKTKAILHRGRFIIQADLDLRNLGFSFLPKWNRI